MNSNSYGTPSGKWSARKAQALAKAYKKAGGVIDNGSSTITKVFKELVGSEVENQVRKESLVSLVKDIYQKSNKRLSSSEYARSTAKKRKNRKRAKYSKKIASMVRNALKVV